MRRVLVIATALAALAAPTSHAGTPMWAETFVSEFGMSTADGIRAGTAAVVIGGQNVVTSKDYGRTWTPLVLSPPNGGSSQTTVAVTTPTRWYAENGRAVSMTTDAGASWRPVPIRPVISNPHESFEGATNVAAADNAPSALIGWSAARVRDLCPYAVDFTPLFVTRDAGARWTRVDLPAVGDAWGIEWFDASHAAVVLIEYDWTEPERNGNECVSEGIFRQYSVWLTSDAGRSFRRAFTWKHGYVAAAWSSPTSVAVVAERNGGGISFVSNDSGRTFSRSVPVYANNGFNGFPTMEFVEHRRGWVGAILAGVFRSDSGGYEWAHEASTADGSFYGVPSLTALDGTRAVNVTPRAVITRLGDVPGTPPAAPVDRVAFDGLTVTTTIGAVTRTVTHRAYGPPVASLRVVR
ncbi:MAG TPA: hypothetical protein VGX28_01405 [Frankiaceae bacterium]|jgi:photosystem II stability/assembly factor-like uncharacterized protein|nr:hypothetical protein [Frankiaceae bacterium]